MCISGVSSAAAADVIKEFTDKVSEAGDKDGFLNSHTEEKRAKCSVINLREATEIKNDPEKKERENINVYSNFKNNINFIHYV